MRLYFDYDDWWSPLTSDWEDGDSLLFWAPLSFIIFIVRTPFMLKYKQREVSK